MSRPLHHIVRLRTTDDLRFLREGVMDATLINANQLENSPESTAAALRNTALPFSIDPMLTRFQVPAWWRNSKGENKRNYVRLGAAYIRGTSIQLPAGPLVQTVTSDEDWTSLARNVIAYQHERLTQLPVQLDLFSTRLPRVLRPSRLTAPALVALSPEEDRINRLLADASIDVATLPLDVQLIVPTTRLTTPVEIARILKSTPRNGVSSYLVWTPGVSEELLLTDHRIFTALLELISGLAERGVPVGHLHATYPILALHDAGLSAAVHHLGWTENGEPVEQTGGGPRSCRTYVPGVRHCLRFAQAEQVGGGLDTTDYASRYCDCAFCIGAFESGIHPLRLLLEDYQISTGKGGTRRTPTARAVELNTWHHLLSRRKEIEMFSTRLATEVVAEDIQRAAAVAQPAEAARLRRLARELPTG
jgi:hypothetical protein